MRFSWILALSLLASTAAAKLTPEQQKEARAHYDRATIHYNLGEFPDAAKEFQAAFQIAGHPAILYNVAQSYRFAEDYKQAALFFRTYLTASPKATDRAVIEKRIADLEAKAAGKKEPKPETKPSETKPAAKPAVATAPPSPVPVATAAASERLKPITDLIKANRAGFRACFDEWSKKHPGIGGKVSLLLYLSPEGNLDMTATEVSGFDAPEVEDCMVAHARTLSYPASPSGKFTRFTYPFDFKPLR